MLTAVESFFSTEKDANIMIEGGEFTDASGIQPLGARGDERTVKKSQASANNGGSSNNNNNNSKKLNTTMASFFAPLPIITSSFQPSAEHTSDAQDPNKNDVDGQKQQSVIKATEMKHVARYGRIYKRKAASKVGYAHIPCPPGHRYCKECAKPMPLDKFYVNAKRYICKRHHYLRVNKRFKERIMSSDYEKMGENAWFDLFRISPMLGYAKVDYDRHDIKDLVINTKIPLSIIPRAVPIDPSIPMRPRNVAIVSSANMALLLKIYVMTCSRAQYILLVQACNLLPENADAGIPWAPFENPAYMRQDIDVIPILEMESKMPKERPHVEAVREMMQEDEKKINECKNRLGREESENSVQSPEESS